MLNHNLTTQFNKQLNREFHSSYLSKTIKRAYTNKIEKPINHLAAIYWLESNVIT